MNTLLCVTIRESHTCIIHAHAYCVVIIETSFHGAKLKMEREVSLLFFKTAMQSANFLESCTRVHLMVKTNHEFPFHIFLRFNTLKHKHVAEKSKLKKERSTQN